MRVGDDVSANQGAGTGVGVRSLVDAWGTQLAPPTSNLAQPHRVVDDHRQAGRWVGVRFDPMVTRRARVPPLIRRMKADILLLGYLDRVGVAPSSSSAYILRHSFARTHSPSLLPSCRSVSLFLRSSARLPPCSSCVWWARTRESRSRRDGRRR